MRIGVGLSAIWGMAGLLLAGAPAGASDGLPGPVPATVLRVVDGDTLRVRAEIWLDQWIEVSVRLRGVDTPELRGKCASEKAAAAKARDWLAAVAVGGVLLHDIGPDKYASRVDARVVAADGRDLAAGLIAAGLARAYAGEKREGWCG